MKVWNKIKEKKIVDRTIAALKSNGIEAFSFGNSEELKKKLFELIPSGAEVFTMSSRTLEDLGIAKEINESGNYDSIRNKLTSMNRETQGREMRKLGASPDWTIGSVHAVTEDGKLLIASKTGSQLAAYVSGAEHVVFIIGTQKITKNFDEAMERIYDYVLPLESIRVKKAYGLEHSDVNKILVINKEEVADRIKVFFVDAVVGF